MANQATLCDEKHYLYLVGKFLTVLQAKPKKFN